MAEKNTATASREIGISRLLNAPRELVWEAWTNPEHIKHWWGPAGFTNTIHSMDVKPGGILDFIMHGPDGMNFKNIIVYKEVVKPEKLVYDHGPTPRFEVTVTFVAQGNKTLVTMNSVFEAAEELAFVIKQFKADVGMVQHMDRMEDYLSKM